MDDEAAEDVQHQGQEQERKTVRARVRALTAALVVPISERGRSTWGERRFCAESGINNFEVLGSPKKPGKEEVGTHLHPLNGPGKQWILRPLLRGTWHQALSTKFLLVLLSHFFSSRQDLSRTVRFILVGNENL